MRTSTLSDQDNMKVTRFAVLAILLIARSGTAEAKAYKGAEVFSLQSSLYGRMEMRMRMIRGSGLVSTFFTYKNGSEVSGTAWEELDVEVFGKGDAKSWQSNIITGNPRVTSEQVHPSETSLADGYHTYTLEWTPDYVSWALDGEVVRKTEGGQVSSLTNPESFRFNVWSSEATGWAGTFDETALPAYQFVNWIKYYRYENGQFTLDWTDDFETFDPYRWSTGNWTFDGNRVDFDPDNAVVKDGTLVLALTKEDATGFSGTVPTDGDAGGCGCTVGGLRSPGGTNGMYVMAALAVAAVSRNRRAARAGQGARRNAAAGPA
jgi:endo-1,3-1,4-beta-glycanase ExoK